MRFSTCRSQIPNSLIQGKKIKIVSNNSIATMGSIAKPGDEGILMNRKDPRDFNVPEAPVETLFSYFRLAEYTNIEQFKEDMKTNADMPPLPKGYVWAPLIIGRDVDFEGPPAIALPMVCIICHEPLDHMSSDCPHRNEESYAARIEIILRGNSCLLGNNKFLEKDA